MPPVLTRLEHLGAAVLVIEDHALPAVRFAFALRRGAGLDPPRQSGACGLMMELCLRGTRTRSRAQMADALEEMGSSLWIRCGHELVLMGGSCLARHAAATTELARASILEPALDADERRRLIDELVVELQAMRDDDGSVADLFLYRALYGDHPYARSAAGEVPELKRLDDEAVRAAYRRHWFRDDLIAVFAGDVTPDEALALARPVIEGLPSRDGPAPVEPAPSPGTGTRVLVVDKPERSQIQMRLARLTLPGTHPDMLPLWLGVLAFGGTFTSPFTHEVREVRGWSYSAHAGVDRRRRTPAPLVMYSAPAVADAVDCLALELDLYAAAARGEIDDTAFGLAKDYALNRFPFEVATAADMVMLAVRAELLGQPLPSLLELPRLLAAVEPEAARAALRAHLHPAGVSAVLVATAADVVEPLRARLPDAAVQVIDYQDGLE